MMVVENLVRDFLDLTDERKLLALEFIRELRRYQEQELEATMDEVIGETREVLLEVMR